MNVKLTVENNFVKGADIHVNPVEYMIIFNALDDFQKADRNDTDKRIALELQTKMYCARKTEEE